MYNRNSASTRGWQQPQNFGNETYPGLGDPFIGLPAPVNPSVLPQTQTGLQSPTGTSKTGLFSQIGEWKQMLDRVGGIDGVLGAVGKMQKLFSTMQQMAPLLRLFIGKGGGAAAAAGLSKNSGARRRRRRTRRYYGRGGYRPYAGGARPRRPASRSPRRRQYPR